MNKHSLISLAVVVSSLLSGAALAECPEGYEKCGESGQLCCPVEGGTAGDAGSSSDNESSYRVC